MFDLDEMKGKWAEHDQKLDTSIRLNWQRMKAANLNGARSALQRMTAFLVVEAICWFVIVIALCVFTYQHAATLPLALPGLALGLYAMGMLVATVPQIGAALRIDYGQPIIGIQKQVEALRVLRIQLVRWGIIAGAVVWAPFAIVLSKVLFGFARYDVAWLWANILFGLALIPVTVWVSKKFGDRMTASPFLQRVMKDIAGHSLTAAGAFITRLREFEEEGLSY
ncbi:MAG: hypothetical protein ACLQVD_09345 [Capsulimonadaceae bacterium]